jgi:uncharacterized protein (TIGR00369 family)
LDADIVDSKVFSAMTARIRPAHFTLEAMTAYLREIFPQAGIGETFFVEEIAPMRAKMRLGFDDKHLRPGGTISGPSMFALADVALYVAVLGEIGRVRLAVTTNLNINFLKKPPPADLIGEARLLKLGKRLAVGEVAIHSAAESELVAHAVGTYSIPAAKHD